MKYRPNQCPTCGNRRPRRDMNPLSKDAGDEDYLTFLCKGNPYEMKNGILIEDDIVSKKIVAKNRCHFYKNEKEE